MVGRGPWCAETPNKLPEDWIPSAESNDRANENGWSSEAEWPGLEDGGGVSDRPASGDRFGSIACACARGMISDPSLLSPAICCSSGTASWNGTDNVFSHRPRMPLNVTPGEDEEDEAPAAEAGNIRPSALQLAGVAWLLLLAGEQLSSRIGSSRCGESGGVDGEELGLESVVALIGDTASACRFSHCSRVARAKAWIPASAARVKVCSGPKRMAARVPGAPTERPCERVDTTHWMDRTNHPSAHLVPCSA
jgi:hypothetical protein